VALDRKKSHIVNRKDKRLFDRRAITEKKGGSKRGKKARGGGEKKQNTPEGKTGVLRGYVRG